MNNSVTYSRLGQNGRLANQMFQIAATIAYALDTKRNFIFPKWEFSDSMIKPLPEGNVNIDYRYCEPNFYYSPIILFPYNGNIDLFGHFQSEKYFKHHKNEILPYLTINDFLQENIKNYYIKIFQQQTCSIHVRRTDYDTPVNRDYHGLMPKEYYESAAKAIYGDMLDDVLFVICSDDVAFTKKFLNFPKMFFVEGEKPLIDMYIMSCCNNHIIANSSFSWWSAFLGINPYKKVVSPKKWFNNAPHNSQDVHCESWITI